MNGKQLKNSILQEAISGRLVPQDPNDEPAAQLLERIREEKARLVREKKIKPTKNETTIYRAEDGNYYERNLTTGDVTDITEEIPFTLPRGWEWTRLGSVGAILNGDRGKNYPAKSTLKRHGIPFISALNLNGKTIVQDDNLLCMSEMQYNRLGNGKLLKGDIVVCIRGSLGKHGKYPLDKGAIASSLVILRLLTEYNCLSDYVMAYLDAPQFCAEIVKFDNGTAQPNLAARDLSLFLLPLPPLAEQRRIVAKVEELLPVVERYEKAQSALDALNGSIRKRLKASILQEAIRGRLVPQDPNDEPAAQLLVRIREEKARLVREKKIKPTKNETTIYQAEDGNYYERNLTTGAARDINEEIPFTLPRGWEWTRLGLVCQLLDGERRTGKGVCLDAKYLRGKSEATFIDSGRFVSEGENIILVDGENSGEVFEVPTDGYMGSTFKLLWLCQSAHLPYLLLFILFNKQLLRENKRGAAIPHLNKEIFTNLLLPLPPLAEQRRIVERVEELLAVLDGAAGGGQR